MSAPFQRVLIANRGEIACRIIRTCRRLGIYTIAVFSEADRSALHVKQADAALCVGPARARESYLDVDRIIAAAKATGAEAIHPGYGFLAENAGFARAVRAAGLGFVGPRAETIAAMGSKSAAKALMERAGVPVVPGYHGEQQAPGALADEALRIGFPLMIKPAAGGGGKGMRIVVGESGFAAALEGAKREARNAFDDEEVILEKYIEHPRHIEFQIFGDTRGNIVHMFERECTLQRRFQKVVEETPSPFLKGATRAAMARAAVAAAQAVDYLGAGTVEFIAGTDQSFYFMEMNTRLQVEHPVTEATTGIDLVEWQLRVAAGEALPLRQSDIRRSGHAIEARVYAENPGREFVPAPGRIEALYWPEEPAVRIDSGVEAGDVVGEYYDPLLAKITVAAEDRAAAIHALRRALADTAVFGLTTNLSLLRGLARHTEFEAARFDTGFIERELARLLAPPDWRTVDVAAATACLLTELAPRAGPWRADAFRLTPGGGWRFGLRGEDTEKTLWTVRGAPPSFELDDGRENHAVRAEREDGRRWEVAVGREPARRLGVCRAGQHFQVGEDERACLLEWVPAFAPGARRAGDEAHPQSPMPGRVVAIHVGEGDRVEPGSALVTLEGMKMEYTVKATVAGTVAAVYYAEGERVEAEALLVEIRPAGETGA